MPRPKRLRNIMSRPSISGFRPEGRHEQGEVCLSLEEFEAIRLIDFQGLDQSQAAEVMRVSRQTFGRILKSARFTVSKALVKACRLKIEGGCYEIKAPHPVHGERGQRRGQGRREGAGAQRKGMGPGSGKR